MSSSSKMSGPEIVTIIVLAILAFAVKLFVITKVWALTAVPLGAPQIGIFQAFAMSFLAETLCLNGKSVENSEKKEFGDVVTTQIALILVLLLTWGLAALIF